MNRLRDFVIIDDDKINNKICRKIIEQTYPGADITDFTDPQEGFDFIVNKYSDDATDSKCILLLDINMPVMSAWDFLDVFDELNAKVKSNVIIHILSSSVNKRDMARAKANKYVDQYLIKPLTRETIHLV